MIFASIASYVIQSVNMNSKGTTTKILHEKAANLRTTRVSFLWIDFLDLSAGMVHCIENHLVTSQVSKSTISLADRQLEKSRKEPSQFGRVHFFRDSRQSWAAPSL